MKKLLATIFVFCLSLSLWAQESIKDSSDYMPDPAGAGPTATLTDGGVNVTVNSYGKAGHTSSGCGGVGAGFRIDETDSVLCEHGDYVSVSGAPKRVNPANCTIVNPITADAPNHATSTVMCGACQVDFDHTADDASKSWTTTVTLTGCGASGCHYAYSDYDVHGFQNNIGVWIAAAGPALLGQFAVRNAVIGPNVHYTFTDQSGATHWEQGEFPTVRNKLDALTTCGNLADAPARFMGDWTGAIQFPWTAGEDGTATITYSHGRDDTTDIP